MLFGVTGGEAQVDTSTLGGGTGIFRVVASDSVNQGFADSAPFQIAVKPPKVAITSPAEGAVYNWGQLVHLAGDALDTLDGLLPGGSLTWSNQYGNLGNGTVLDVATLPVGINVLTLTASNSAGLSATQQVTITVGDELNLPGPLLQAAPAELGFQLAADGPASDLRSLALTNGGGGGAIAWAVASSAPWLTVDIASGADVPATLQVTANRAGLAANVEHLATLTFTGTPAGGTAQVIVVPVSLAIGNSTVGGGSGVTAPTLTERLYLPTVFGMR